MELDTYPDSLFRSWRVQSLIRVIQPHKLQGGVRAPERFLRARRWSLTENVIALGIYPSGCRNNRVVSQVECGFNDFFDWDVDRAELTTG